MAGLKTQRTDADALGFISGIDDPFVRRDCERLYEMLEAIVGQPGRMWGKSMVGFGRYHYTNTTGRPQSWFLCGFAPRKRELSVYVMPGFSAYGDIMKRLGRYKTGKSCLTIKHLADVDEAALSALLEASVLDMRSRYEWD